MATQEIRLETPRSSRWGIHANTFGEWPLEAFVKGDYIANEGKNRFGESRSQPAYLELHQVLETRDRLIVIFD
ncbi:MAG: hypothetical protein AB7E98_11925 [Pirellulales bacterium]